ncbi:hypothetical protein [Ovoidimarina sediminis]|uniref:hypothetical protein n=1 Tax=Ovoidimarina sediminis TaxID=3079856 RepID=UPI00290B2C89|nr:hypothetical protein [Rhodophyticola sp. MJ-SS7]MDU8946460.1 hypothetical protein [Rhodophyticola sp. MJ-SS7]
MAVVLALFPVAAHANVIFPAVALTPALLILLLIPAIIIEAIILWFGLNISVLKALGTSLASNVVSTLPGIPIALLASAMSAKFVEAIVERLRIGKVSSIQSLEDRPSFWFDVSDSSSTPVREPWIGWAGEAAVCLTLVFTFLASWFVERYISTRILSEFEPDRVSAVVFYANSATYLILVYFLVETGVSEYRAYRKAVAKRELAKEERARFVEASKRECRGNPPGFSDKKELNTSGKPGRRK